MYKNPTSRKIPNSASLGTSLKSRKRKISTKTKTSSKVLKEEISSKSTICIFTKTKTSPKLKFHQN